MLIYNYKVAFLRPKFEVFELRAICKEIAERRMGRIWAESMQGLTSYFSIPVRGGDNPEGLSDIAG